MRMMRRPARPAKRPHKHPASKRWHWPYLPRPMPPAFPVIPWPGGAPVNAPVDAPMDEPPAEPVIDAQPAADDGQPADAAPDAAPDASEPADQDAASEFETFGFETETAEFGRFGNAGAAARRGGTVTIDKVPLLRRHAGIGPDLILTWNELGVVSTRWTWWSICMAMRSRQARSLTSCGTSRYAAASTGRTPRAKTPGAAELGRRSHCCRAGILSAAPAGEIQLPGAHRRRRPSAIGRLRAAAAVGDARSRRPEVQSPDPDRAFGRRRPADAHPHRRGSA